MGLTLRLNCVSARKIERVKCRDQEDMEKSIQQFFPHQERKIAEGKLQG